MLRRLPATIVAVNNNTITHPGCVFVALDIQHSMRMHHIFICVLPGSKKCFHFISSARLSSDVTRCSCRRSQMIAFGFKRNVAQDMDTFSVWINTVYMMKYFRILKLSLKFIAPPFLLFRSRWPCGLQTPDCWDSVFESLWSMALKFVHCVCCVLCT